ncbi:MAG: hypothetical protein MJ169_01165 [Treponema sp.]|nr:hypothetical protein [Treponema sp.]
MNEFPRTIEQLNALAPAASNGSVIEKDGDLWYKIENYDSIPPFFMTITSSSDIWNFIWSSGALSAGRKDSSHAVFPYYTCDKIDDGKTNTGSYTAVKVLKDGQTFYWQPFSSNRSFKIQRNLYKNSAGSHIIFEEINCELGLTFCQEWTSSQKYGIVRKASIKNTNSETAKIQILDGCRNIMPACGTVQLQNDSSVLLDAYKKTDLDTEAKLSMFSLSSVLSDRAEPSEALWANTCWFSTMDKVYLDSAVETQFASDASVTQSIDEIAVLKGGRPSCMIMKSIDLAANQDCGWYQVFDTKLELSRIGALKDAIKDRAAAVKDLEADIKAGKELLDQYIAGADGIQDTNDKITCIHHKANVMFNIMRGGIFADNNKILMADFVKFVKGRSAVNVEKAVAVCKAEETTYAELAALVKATGDDQLYRLFLEYLPLSFSRRHGDPSRPWNKFNINLKDSLGNPILNYEGNWRDIFQNWEALAMSYPCFTMGMIAKFVNAVSCDGFNPYRITRAGLDWEVPEPENPWSNIGYWNDHQIIYLCKLLELQSQLDPEAFNEVLNKKLFSTSNIPYHIKSYEDLCKNPRDSIQFDYDLNDRIEADVKKYGTDSKLMGKDGSPYLVTLTSKLLQLILTKLANFVPGGGIWMNTQRPEWNDANNALAGYGLSMVTTCYLRRMLTFLKDVYSKCPSANFEVPSEIKKLMNALVAAYAGTKPQDTMDSSSRNEFVKTCGTAFAAERLAFYNDYTLLNKTENVSKEEILAAIDTFLVHIEYSIKLNKKDNGLYHSYNTLAISANGMKVEYLQEMLEGQVAVLSSKMLSPKEVCELYTSLKNSGMYEKRQHSYMLYPNKELPFFEQKNIVDKIQAVKFAFLKSQLDNGYTSPSASCVIYNDAVDANSCHFNPDFRNAGLLEAALKANGVSDSEIEGILALYESTFHHSSFTGRSGTFYAYEGLGSIYWHMVSKLLLAVQENFDMAADGSAEKRDLAAAYYEVRNGLGFNKTPELYGAFPTDPYSHTPSGQGAKQPGMTGQVKEEVITRWGELGMRLNDGKLCFKPDLLCKKEFTQDGTLSFTRFGVPFTYKLNESADKCTVKVDSQSFEAEISKEASAKLFAREGEVKSVTVEVPAKFLLNY